MAWDFSSMIEGTKSDSTMFDPFAAITTTFVDPFKEQFGGVLPTLPEIPFTPFWEIEGFQLPQLPQLPSFPELAFPEWQMPDLFGGMQNFWQNQASAWQNMFGGVGNWFGNIGQGLGGVFGGVVQWFGKWWWAIVLVLVVIVLLYFSPVLLPMLTGAGKGMKGLGMAQDIIGIAKKVV